MVIRKLRGETRAAQCFKNRLIAHAGFASRSADRGPAGTGIETLQPARLVHRAGAEISLIDLSFLIDDEGHDAGIAVPCRVGDDGEASDGSSADDVVERARLRTLALS